MSKIYAYPRSNPGQVYSYTCADLWFDEAVRLNAFEADSVRVHPSISGQRFYGISGRLPGSILDGDTSVKLFYPEHATPLTGNFTRGDLENLNDGYRCVTLKPEKFSMVLGAWAGDKDSAPAEYQATWRAVKERYFDTGRQDLDLYTVKLINGEPLYCAVPDGHQLETSNVPQYYTCSSRYSEKFNVRGGLHNLQFGVRNQSMYYTIPGSNDLTFFTYGPQDVSFSNAYCIKVGSTTFPASTPHWNSHMAACGGDDPSAGNRQYMTAETSFNFGNSVPIHFTVKAGTNIGGYTFTEDVVMFGICGYTVDYVDPSIIGSVAFVAVDDKQWKNAEQRKIDFGDDTDPAGGTGAFTPGADDPTGNTDLASKYGLSTDPATQTGFFIYKMTEDQLNDFLKSAASSGGVTSTSLPASAAPADIGSWVGEYVSNAIGTSTIADNIVFVYRSPLIFPSVSRTISTVPVGNAQIKKGNNTSWTVDCVTDTIIRLPFNNSETIWGATSFSDLEPYASTWISIPFCESVPIPPSFLYNSTLTINVLYELVTRAANASIVINKNSSINKYSAAGECAAVAPIVYKTSSIGRDFVSTAASFATSVSKISSGGGVTSQLIGTAAGAALGFLSTPHTETTSSIPSSSSGSPYWDTVNYGTQKVAVYGAKTRRLTSEEGEGGIKGLVQGYKSCYCVSSLSSIGTGNYVQITDVQVPMSGGMTLAEHDKIVALLRQGVIL